MGVLRVEKDWCVDDDKLVIWSFEGVGESAYNILVEQYGIKEVVINLEKEGKIPEAVFKDCSGIEKVIIKGGVTGIGDYAFFNCSELITIIIEGGITSIGPYAFEYCSELTSVTILDSVTSIGNHAFQNCSRLISITIPDSVTSIGNYAFFGCSNLKNISIPAQLQINMELIADSGCAITRRPNKETEMEVLGKDLVEGTFYHALSGHLDFDDVWYRNGRSLINPRNKDHGHCIDVVWAYYPLTVEDVDAFTDWMAKNGDEAGIKAWKEYKDKLIKGAEMAKKDDKEKRENVDLYDPKFVHFDWDESLRGKKGFRADDMGMLKSTIRDIGIADMGTLIGFKNEAAPFIVKLPREDCYSYWQFFYYDPNYEVKWAYFKEEKNIQMRRGSADEWEDVCPWSETVAVDGPEYFDDNYEYRIKPEEEPKVEVNVDVKVNGTVSDGEIKITINGKECIFENAEQARMVLNS